jgi:addiction module HigA family antidote
MFNPSHPGEILRQYMGNDLTVSALADHLHVTRANLSMILNGRSGISAPMSLKLDDAFGTSEGFWLRLQTNYDLAQARRTKKVKIRHIHTIKAKAKRPTAAAA